MTEHEDDLVASKTEGFKIGEKKTIEEYTKLGMSRLYTLPFHCSLSGNSSLHSGSLVNPLPQASRLENCKLNTDIPHRGQTRMTNP
jgi:hypothetical protein